MFTTIKQSHQHHLTMHNNTIKVNYSLLTNIQTTSLQMINHIANNLNKDNIFVKHLQQPINNINHLCKQYQQEFVQTIYKQQTNN